MLASQRRATIASLVAETGAVRVADLVEQLGVSDMTIRRDIEQLAREGLVERVHGGALAVGARSSEEPGFTAKSGLMTAQKRAIAQRPHSSSRAHRSASPRARPPSSWRGPCGVSRTSRW